MIAIISFTIIACGLLSAGVNGAVAAKITAESPIVAKCKVDLAKRLELKTEDITVAEIKAMTWPNTALGMPETGKVYAQVQTPGSKVILEVHNAKYLYTTSETAFKYGGPLSVWDYSMLYLQPMKNEPNLNNDLYQCSLLGTNSVHLATTVDDYYPQEKGAIIISRRTSRSSFDLLYIKADKPGKENMLCHAFSFGPVAFNSTQDQWAGYIRTRVGSDWVVVVNGVNQDASKEKIISLPEETKPEKIAWSVDKLMILVKKNDRLVAFKTDPKAANPTWQSATLYDFPGQDSLILNRSETLSIEQVEKDGKQNVEVTRVWFTGERKPVINIDNFSMQGYEVLKYYAFIWGEKDSKPAAYTVNIRTGESVASFLDRGMDIKPFIYSPKAQFISE